VVLHYATYKEIAMQAIMKGVVKGRIGSAVETRNIWYAGCDELQLQYLEDDIVGFSDHLDDIYSILVGITHSLVTFYEYEFYTWDGEEWQPSMIIPKNIIGTETVDLGSYQTAVLFTFNTAVKNMRGRKFFPGVDELMTELGALTVDALAICANAMIVCVTGFEGGVGRTWFPGCPGKGSPFAPWLSGTVGTILSSMRRRKPGYGI